MKLLLHFLILGQVGLISLMAVSTNANRCEDIHVEGTGTNPWVTIPGVSRFCYAYSSTPFTWEAANQHCKSLSSPGNEEGDLTSLDNPEEASAIFNYWNNAGTNLESGYWIGLNRGDVTGQTRRWTDYSRLRINDQAWQEGEPTNNCAYVANEGATDEEKMKWKTASCSTVTKPFICERKNY
nr:C-type lectin domain family 4 member G-like [Lytechinus pictus]